VRGWPCIAEVVHTLVSSVLLLNTDLHSGHVERKMRVTDFVENVQGALTEDERPPDTILRVRGPALSTRTERRKEREREREREGWARRYIFMHRSMSVAHIRLYAYTPIRTRTVSLYLSSLSACVYTDMVAPMWVDTSIMGAAGPVCGN
jgi:hypothetical protein